MVDEEQITSVKEFLYGKSQVIEAANVEEAVEIAHELKNDGRYNWFRGQVQDWPPRSSLMRVYSQGDSELNEKTVRRFAMFYKWIEKIPELRYLAAEENVHDAFAIMQHYGIPTHYIDFTTDPAVAGFFSADTKDPPADGMACIYCLNTEILQDTWKSIKEAGERDGANIEAVTIDVENLWRLQAQCGTFVYADYNWEVDYPLDRIVFPYRGYPSYPTRERIYPDQKSPLQQLLDQFFSVEQSTDTVRELSKMFKELQEKGHNTNWAHWETFELGFYADAFHDKDGLIGFESWQTDSRGEWEKHPVEQFHETVGRTLKINLNGSADPAELHRALKFGVIQLLRSEPDIRGQAVDWSFENTPSFIDEGRLNELLVLTWNGMRRLPYDDTDIGDALGSVIAFYALTVTTDMSPFNIKECHASYFGESMEVAFGYVDGSDSRALIARATLHNALRGDMGDLLAHEHKARVDDIRELFKVIYNPSLMFDFELFKLAFAREIIPSQVVLGRTPVLYNPVRLYLFGLP